MALTDFSLSWLLASVSTLALPLSLAGCGSKAEEAKDGGDKAAERGAMPEACRRDAAPSSTSLGLKPEPFIACLEQVLGTMTLPEQANKPLQKGDDGSYAIAGFMSVTMTVEEGSIAAMDVIFFNELREAHGMGPELGAQYAVLAIVFPSAQVNPFEGKTIFEEIDAIGRKTNRPVIDYEKDGIALNASFLPISVRYRFTPKA